MHGDGCYTDALITMESRLRYAAIALVVSLLAGALFAADPGRADGTLTIDKERVTLGYAYAIGRQRNEITNRKDDIRVILTDKPLASDANLTEIEATFPEGMYGVIFNVASNKQVTHVALLHPKGSYDGGYLEDFPDFRFKPVNPARGTISGHLTTSRVQTNTMTFSVDADFNAPVR